MPNYADCTPLHYCQPKLSLFKILIEAGADIHCKDSHRNGILHHICMYRPENYPTSYQMDPKYFNTLMNEVLIGELENIVRYLVDKGVNLDDTNADGFTPLMRLYMYVEKTYSNHSNPYKQYKLEMMKTLVLHNADLCIRAPYPKRGVPILADIYRHHHLDFMDDCTAFDLAVLNVDLMSILILLIAGSTFERTKIFTFLNRVLPKNEPRILYTLDGLFKFQLIIEDEQSKELYDQYHMRVYDLLLNPYSLKHLAIIAARKALGAGIRRKLLKLEIPESVRSVLLLPELKTLRYIDNSKVCVSNVSDSNTDSEQTPAQQRSWTAREEFADACI